ncbi:unnamed protein product [Paramecium octaurelia]|uniref:PX domain-containing protein n=1 Tax=Paramecium octaurelia TaxID=43137 RepID=A0A8S1S6V2_PAROT|nr:unnamed protein product [Paramecium octaurelia]
MSNEEIEERRQDLEIFMKVILNDSQYHVSALFKFIGMSQYLEDQESELIKKLHIKIQDLKKWLERMFDDLHSLLKQRYPLLPQLPYKTTAALQQISPNIRCMNLQQYLLDLIKVPTIGENSHLRWFLEVRSFDNNASESGFGGSNSQFDRILQRLDNNNQDLEQLENMHNSLWQ